MALKINDDCIVCDACLPECPNNAIYEPGVEWSMRDGTTLKGNAPLNNDLYYIVPDKCTECQGFHEEPRCAEVCPVDACVPDDMYRETVDELMAKKERLHI